MDDGWVTSAEAAAALGVTRNQAAWLARRGRLIGELHAAGWRIDRASLERLVAERERDTDEWVSYVEAGTVAGVSHHSIWLAVRAGELVTRDQPGTHLPSLRRADVEAWAAGRRQARAAAARRASRLEATETARRAESEPPDDGHVWLDVATVAVILGLTPAGVRYRVNRDLLPHVRRGGRTWLRRDHVEQVAAARARRALHDA